MHRRLAERRHYDPAHRPMDVPRPPDDIVRTRPRRALVLLALIVLAALVLRLPGLLEGEWTGNRDELNYVPKALRIAGGRSNPGYYHNPPLMSVLSLGAIGARYAAGRVTGEVASAEDFKARFLLDGVGAFTAARTLSLLLGLATVVHVASLAAAVSKRDDGGRSATFAGLLAAAALAASPLHVERSGMATNEVLVTLAYGLAVHAALVLVRTGTWRAAVAAGLLAGLAGASKYTGALVCVPVAAAAVLAGADSPAVRARRLLTAAAAAAAGFVLFCPWCVLDARVFVSHVLDQAQLKDRWQDGRGWLRYAETAWTTGVGPAACIAFLCAAGAAVAAAFRRVEDWRGPVVLVVAVAAPAAFLAAQQDIAYGRYLMPAFPVAIALGCAWLAGLDAGAGWVRRLGAAAVLAVACVAASGLPARWSEATTPTTRDAAGEWIRANVPDGARVLGDWSLPRLPAVEDREAFRGRVPDATWARYRPAYLLDTAWDYFARPVNRLHGTDAAADDFDAMRRIGPVWIVTSSAGETVLAQLPPGDYPPQRWYEGVRREAAPLVEIAPGPGLRGDVLRISVVR